MNIWRKIIEICMGNLSVITHSGCKSKHELSLKQMRNEKARSKLRMFYILI